MWVFLSCMCCRCCIPECVYVLYVLYSFHVFAVGSTVEHCFTTEGIFDPLAGILPLFSPSYSSCVCIFEVRIPAYLTCVHACSCRSKRPLQLGHLPVQVLQVSYIEHILPMIAYNNCHHQGEWGPSATIVLHVQPHKHKQQQQQQQCQQCCCYKQYNCQHRDGNS